MVVENKVETLEAQRGVPARAPTQGTSDDVVVDLRGPEPVIHLVPYAGVFLTEASGLLAARTWQLAAKRAIDIIGAGVALLAFAPVLIAAAIAIRLDSPGPVFFRQRRVARDGDTFDMMKLRTMSADAPDIRSSLDDENEKDGPIFKIRDDPRVTRVGRFLRKFSVDELPQLLHVLGGRMSLVGPRPPLVEEAAEYGDWERQRLLPRPGLTCIWQISGRSDLDFKTWVEMDIDYIERWSIRLDVSLLARTVGAVLSGKGAY